MRNYSNFTVAVSTLSEVVFFANEALVGHNVQFVAGIELFVTHETRETVEMKHPVSGFSNEVGRQNGFIAARASRSESPEKGRHFSISSRAIS